MATQELIPQWKCQDCRYVGPESEFVQPDGTHRCPKPADEHRFSGPPVDVFPHRLFRCEACGREGDHFLFFEDWVDVDPDPIAEGVKAKPHEYPNQRNNWCTAENRLVQIG